MPHLHLEIKRKTRHSQFRISQPIKRVILSSRLVINNLLHYLLSHSLRLKVQKLMTLRQRQHHQHPSNQNLKIKAQILNLLLSPFSLLRLISNSNLQLMLLRRLCLQRLVIQHHLSHRIHHEVPLSNLLIQLKSHLSLPMRQDRSRLLHQFQRRKRYQFLQRILNQGPNQELLILQQLLRHLQQSREQYSQKN